MSGGHYDYLCYKIEDTYSGDMLDETMEELLKDFCGILKSLEWFRSCDTGVEDYMGDVAEFKKKWFNSEHPANQNYKSDVIHKLETAIAEIKEL